MVNEATPLPPVQHQIPQASPLKLPHKPDGCRTTVVPPGQPVIPPVPPKLLGPEPPLNRSHSNQSLQEGQKIM